MRENLAITHRVHPVDHLLDGHPPLHALQRPSSSRPATGPNKDRRREDLPARGGSSDRRGATRNVSTGREASDPRGFRATPQDRDQSRIRPRIFEPDIPDEITGEELEKSVRAELLSLSAENAKVVARHLVSINIHMDSDPELAHKHGSCCCASRRSFSSRSRERGLCGLSRGTLRNCVKRVASCTSNFW
jgi:hypothetical protein